MPAISRLGDIGIHIGSGQQGAISSTSSVNVITFDGKPIALQGDLYTCSISNHNNTPNLLIPFPTQTGTTSNGKRVITVGATSTCGATIIQGFPGSITEPPAPPIVLNTYINSTPMNVPLVIPNSALESTGLDLDLLPLSLISVQNSINGNVSMSPPGFVTFTPNTGYIGSASFTYTLGNVNGSTSPISATITVM